MPTIKFRRGVRSELPAAAEGEPLFTTDEQRLYMGANGGLVPMASLNDLANQTIPLIVGTQTASTNLWTGDAPMIDGLYTGFTILYYLPFAGTSAAATLQLKLKDGALTPALPVYRQSASTVTTTYPQYSITLFTYFANGLGTVSTAGWWSHPGYIADTYDRVQYNNAVTMALALYRHKWIMQNVSGAWHPLFPNDKTSTAVAGSWGISTQEFLIGSPLLYYNATTSIAAGAAVSSGLQVTAPHDIRYNINVASLSNGDSVLLKGKIGPNGGFVIEQTNYYVTDFPATDDGYYYLYVGYMYSTTALRLVTEHPVYYRKNGKLGIYTGESVPEGIDCGTF